MDHNCGWIDHNDENSRIRVTLHDILRFKECDSLLHNDNENNKDSYDIYGDGPDHHLYSDDEDLQNLVNEEMIKTLMIRRWISLINQMKRNI